VTTARLGWADLPVQVREQVAAVLGAGPEGFEPAIGGFSAGGVVGTVFDDGGRSLFIKCVPAHHAAAPDYRVEAQFLRALPSPLPFAALRLFLDELGWVVLGLDALQGTVPQEPWERRDLAAALATLSFTTDLLTPAPVVNAPTLGDRMRGRCHTWGQLQATGRAGALSRDDLRGWERAHLRRLAEHEARWAAAVTGSTLLHFDLRHDNCLVTPQGDVVFIDWGRACVGPPWVDLVCLLLLSDIGEVRPWEVFDDHPVGVAADAEQVDAFLVALASYWRSSAAGPSAAGAPHLRRRRVRSRDWTLDWLESRWGRS